MGLGRRGVLTMELANGWYAYLDDERLGPFLKHDEAIDTAEVKGWPVER